MAMNRLQRHHRTVCDQYQGGLGKPPTRKQARAWLAPIRKAIAEMKTGEVDSVRGYAITRIYWRDEDFARVDHAINGFAALIARLMPDFDISAMTRLSKKLETGVMLTMDELIAGDRLLNICEDRLIHITRSTLTDAANTEMVNIELERLGLKDAA